MQEKTDSLLLSMFGEPLSFASVDRTSNGILYSHGVSQSTMLINRSLHGVYSFSLPFTSAAHIVGIPQTDQQSIQEYFLTSALHPLVLEGDYGRHFRAYTDDEVNARYVLDPSAMEHSIDYLTKCRWEIAGATLYVLDDEVLPSLGVIDDFIREISPAKVESQSLNLKIIEQKETFTPYDGPMKCPLCHERLAKGKNWLACATGHGYLMTGSQLINTRIESASFEKELAEALGRIPKQFTEVQALHHSEIQCPNCNHTMDVRDYQQTGILLDVCTKCPYRWIDGTELNDILGRYRHE